jgi:ribosomal protein L32
MVERSCSSRSVSVQMIMRIVDSGREKQMRQAHVQRSADAFQHCSITMSQHLQHQLAMDRNRKLWITSA